MSDHNFPNNPPPRAWLTPPSRDFERPAPFGLDQPEDGEMVRRMVSGVLAAIALFGVMWGIGHLTMAESRALAAAQRVQP